MTLLLLLCVYIGQIAYNTHTPPTRAFRFWYIIRHRNTFNSNRNHIFYKLSSLRCIVHNLVILYTQLLFRYGYYVFREDFFVGAFKIFTYCFYKNIYYIRYIATIMTSRYRVTVYASVILNFQKNSINVV